MKTNNSKFDGSNTGTYSKYVRPSYAMEVIVIIIALGMAIFAGLVFTGKVHAMSAGYIRPEGCHTYSVGAVFGGEDNQEAVLCGDNSPALHTADTAKNDKPSQPVTQPAREVVTDDLPTVITDSTDTTDTTDNTDSNVPTVTVKVHCNNGEGNGGEGCSPAKSDNANNDENSTTPKEDKSHK